MCGTPYSVMLTKDAVDLTKLGTCFTVPVGCIECGTIVFRSPDSGGTWPTALVMEIKAGLSEDTLLSWPGGALTLNSGSTFPYISQELRVKALPWIGVEITTVCSSSYRGWFGFYGEGMK